MNEKLLKHTLYHIAERLVPAVADPSSSIKQRLGMSTTFHAPEVKSLQPSPSLRLQLRPVYFGALLLVILVAVLLTPQGRAWAQQYFPFFNRSSDHTIPVSETEASKAQQILTPQPTFVMQLVKVDPQNVVTPKGLAADASTLPGCSTAFQTLACQSAAAEQRMGFPIWGFAQQPPRYVFRQVDIHSPEQIVLTIYVAANGDGWLTLYQGKGNPPAPLGSSQADYGKIPADKIEVVQVGASTAEYANGMFVVKGGSKEMTWEEGFRQQLGWQKDGYWFLLQEDGQTYLDKEGLIALAIDLVEAKSIQNPTPNPERMNSIVEAEKLAGFHVLQPSMIPLGFQFDYARYNSKSQSVLLVYQGRTGVLMIKQTKDNNQVFRDLTQTYPNVETYRVRGYVAQYVSRTINPKPNSWLEEGNSVLVWREEEMAVQIIFRPVDLIGGDLGVFEMVTIGNSLQ